LPSEHPGKKLNDYHTVVMTTGRLVVADSLLPAQPGVMAYWLSYDNWPLDWPEVLFSGQS
jgi:hypothetical protein